jgi:type IV pilus assembly protein PilN
MAKINLLPWRAALKKQRQIEFAAIIGAIAAFALLGWLAVHLVYADPIAYQNDRNTLLQTETSKLDSQIKEIQELEKEKQRLIARMKAIESLQSSRPLIVRIFDELVTTLPDGVYLTDVRQQGDSIEIQGVAESNARVSNLMRNIEKSQWLKEPNLEIIESADTAGRRTAKFRLKLKQSLPQASSETGDKLS